MHRYLEEKLVARKDTLKNILQFLFDLFFFGRCTKGCLEGFFSEVHGLVDRNQAHDLTMLAGRFNEGGGILTYIHQCGMFYRRVISPKRDKSVSLMLLPSSDKVDSRPTIPPPSSPFLPKHPQHQKKQEDSLSSRGRSRARRKQRGNEAESEMGGRTKRAI